MNDAEKLYLSIMIEEYKTLRDESKQANINMFVTLQFGTVFVGLTLGVGFNQWDKINISVTVFTVIVPLLAAFSMFIWLGEAIRMRRVGDYLTFLEQKIGLLFSIGSNAISNSIYKQIKILQEKAEKCLGFVRSPIDLIDPLCWEHWLRNTRSLQKISFFETSGHQMMIYLIRLIFFPMIAITSFGIGTYRAVHHIDWSKINSWSIDPLFLALIIGFLIITTFVYGFNIAYNLNKKVQPIHYILDREL